jgi:hypothetical protein
VHAGHVTHSAVAHDLGLAFRQTEHVLGLAA